MQNNKKYNSINSQTALAIIANNNTLEILTKMDQALHSTDSFVTVKTTDSTGKETNSQLVTVGFFKQRLDQLYKMVKVLSGVDGNPAALQIANGQFKRIVVADLNLEPKPIPAVTPITTFKADPNWIFDAFLNPKISVELDLTDKIADDTRTIQSKRFIVEFDSILTIADNGQETIELTTSGAARKIEFETKYKGKSNIDLVEFITWLDTPGLVNSVDDSLIDQEYFRVEPNRLQFKGDFTISGTDIDTLNKKLWYMLDTLTYYDITDLLSPPKPIDLKIGDYVNVNPNLKDVKSTTVYKVVEISTISTEYRVRFEQVYGEEPIPVRLNALSVYSDRVKNRSVKISIDFDSYSVIFIRQMDDINNLVGLDWSPGVGFWTNELRLNNDAGELFSEYYVSKVYDYGLVIEDLVAKKVPNYYGIKPFAPVLDENNFKVVQINAHLTQTVEAEKIRDLHNNKNNLVSEIQQIHTAVEKHNRLIQTTSFNSVADKKRANDELTLLNHKLQTKNQTKFSVVQDILSNKKNINKIPAVYHARGFFPMPVAKDSTKTTPQETVQFEIWYRKLSTSGAENPILTIPDINNRATKKASSQNTLNNSNISKPNTINGAFSNWQKYKSDARKRTQDPISGKWFWHIEDVSDAATPNINQIDLPISPGEQIELKIKSLSEVGWPETPVESDYSNTIIIKFPTDLNSVLNEDEFILKEAQADDLKVNFERDLEARGLGLHLNSSLRDVDIYFAHKAEAIASGFKDVNSKNINLYDQLLSMVNKITALEENINKAKGLLEVYLINGGNKERLFTGTSLSFNINLEDYMIKTKIGVIGSEVDSTARTYKNDLMQINNFSLLIKNAAVSSPLGILSYRGYGQPGGLTPSGFAYDGTSLTANRAIQAIWNHADSTILRKDITTNTGTISAAPFRATQQNNQWLWLQIRDLTGNYIYDSDSGQPPNNYWQSTSASLINGSSAIHKTLILKEHNLGYLTGTSNNINADVNPITTITDVLNWEINEDPTNTDNVSGRMGTTIHPVISDFNDIVDISAQLTKIIKSDDANAITFPINIYAKAHTGTGVYTKDPLIALSKNEKYIDNDVITLTGDFPKVNNVANLTNNGVNLRIFLNNSNNTIKVGDKIVISGITVIGITGANNKVLLVKNATTTSITVFFNISAISLPTVTAGAFIIGTSYTIETIGSTNFTSIGAINTVGVGFVATGVGSGTGRAIECKTDGAAELIQVHKRYNNTISGNGPELFAYNVLGKVGTDSRYVNNYLEIGNAIGTASPTVHKKKLRFYLEDESSVRPFEFQITWNITQYKPIAIAKVNTSLLVNTGGFVVGGG